MCIFFNLMVNHHFTLPTDIINGDDVQGQVVIALIIPRSNSNLVYSLSFTLWHGR